MAERVHGTRAATKDPGIESLRAVAVVLMVSGHVIGAGASQGLSVPDDSGWRLAHLALEDLRMPLFTVLSGFVYAYRPVRAPDGMGSLVRGKARRLLVPFVVVCTVFFFVQMITPRVNNRPELSDLPGAYLYGYQHLWFLQAIFLVFLVVGALDAAGLLSTFRGWAGATAAAVVLYVLLQLPDGVAVFSLDGALRLLPFFLLGYGAHRYAARVLERRVLLAASVVLVPLYLARLVALATDLQVPPAASRAWGAAVALLALPIVLGLRRHLRSRALAWLGGFSFGIYLLHVFGTAGMRVAADLLGVDGTALHFALGLAAGVLAPVVFQLTLGRHGWISWAVLGQAPRRAPRSQRTARPVPAPEPAS